MITSSLTKCPRCQKSKEDALKDVEAEYGNVTAVEYRKMIDAFNAMEKEEVDTLKEDAEIEIFEKFFIVNYDAKCTKCFFQFSKKIKEEVL